MRLFLAIPLSKEASKFASRELEDIKRKFTPSDGIRFMPEENWHFTLVFLGQQNESAPAMIEGALKGALADASVPDIEFEKIMYGPPGKNPRMIWLTTSAETSKRVNNIKTGIESKLEKTGVKWRRENRPFRGHLTLARFESKPIETLPNIEKELGFNYLAPSVILMESTLKRSGAEYTPLLKIEFEER